MLMPMILPWNDTIPNQTKVFMNNLKRSFWLFLLKKEVWVVYVDGNLFSLRVDLNTQRSEWGVSEWWKKRVKIKIIDFSELCFSCFRAIFASNSHGAKCLYTKNEISMKLPFSKSLTLLPLSSSPLLATLTNPLVCNSECHVVFTQ